MIFSPHASFVELAAMVPDGVRYYRKLDEALADLVATHRSPTVNVFPHGSLTLLKERASL